MATTSTSSVEEVSFEFKVTQIRTEIETHFNELISYLSNRKKELLIELEEIHNKYKLENDKHKQCIYEITKTQKFIGENIESTTMKGTQTEMNKIIEQKQKEIESEWKPKHISFEFDNTLLDMINGFGKISVVNSSYSCLPVVDYKGKVKPVVSIDTGGSGEGQF
ncbi:hypothetical protein LOD99_11031, partial [Oopsacas minuta]